MAVPATLSTQNLSGKFTLNKKLSHIENMDKMMSLQGLGWMKRKAMGAASPTITISHYKDSEGIEHLDIESQVSGLKNHKEERVLDFAERKKEDGLFGPVVAKSKHLMNLDELSSEFLKKGWTADTIEHGLIYICAVSDTDTAWEAYQTWGIEEVEGERRYTRHVDFKGPKAEHVEVLMVYDYLGN